jgi:hypothetical protein
MTRNKQVNIRFSQKEKETLIKEYAKFLRQTPVHVSFNNYLVYRLLGSVEINEKDKTN